MTSMTYASACIETGSGSHIAMRRGMLTANPTANRRNLSCRSFSRANFSASSLTSPAMPRYWYPASSTAFLMSAIAVSDGL